MTLSEIQSRNYAATVRRGKISDKTTLNEFIFKMFEEVQEFKDDSNFGITDGLELADIIIVCLNTAKHLDIDIQDWLEKKTIINENRV
jgi:NTP pyrophosphatase (non-canonical NTP hydrolase)